MSLPALSRRRVLTNLGAGAATVAGGAVALTVTDGPAHAADISDAATATTAATTTCSTDTAEQEVGPFYVEEGLVRSDITAGEDGIPLTLTVTYVDSDTCAPASGLAVDIWHANAAGVYSDESSEDTVGETYLRGIQVTDDDGQVTFTTIMPGWYAGRTMHVHDRVYSGGTVSGSTYSYAGATLLYTGQYFFPAAVDTAVAGTAPYSSNTTTRTTNDEDRVYTDQSGSENVVTITGSPSQGYVATLTITISGSGTATGTDEDTTSLTLAASATKVTAGATVRLHGVLTDTTTSTPIGGATVRVSRTIAGKTTTGSVTTDDDGAWSITGPVTRTARYEATYAGDDAYHASSSSTVTVKVRTRVVLADVSSTASHRHPVRAHGTVVPATTGTAVVVSRIDSGGTLHRITTVHTDAQGRWEAHWHMAAGRHRVVASVAATTTDLGGRSRVVTVRRT